jgi:hypothetical protein
MAVGATEAPLVLRQKVQKGEVLLYMRLAEGVTCVGLMRCESRCDLEFVTAERACREYSGDRML